MMVLLNGVVFASVTNRDGQMIVMSRKARLFIVSPDGRELQHHDFEYGSTLLVQDKQPVKVRH